MEIPKNDTHNGSAILPNFSSSAAEKFRLSYTPKAHKRAIYNTNNFQGAYIDTRVTPIFEELRKQKHLVIKQILDGHYNHHHPSSALLTKRTQA